MSGVEGWHGCNRQSGAAFTSNDCKQSGIVVPGQGYLSRNRITWLILPFASFFFLLGVSSCVNLPAPWRTTKSVFQQAKCAVLDRPCIPRPARSKPGQYGEHRDG